MNSSVVFVELKYFIYGTFKGSSPTEEGNGRVARTGGREADIVPWVFFSLSSSTPNCSAAGTPMTK
jgi:hypothetical protein